MLFFLIPATFLEPQVPCSWLVTSPCAVGVYPQPAIPLATPCPWMRRGAGAALCKVCLSGGRAAITSLPDFFVKQY